MALEEQKAKNREKVAKRKAALKLVLDYVKDSTEDQVLLSAVTLLTPGQRFGGGAQRVGAKTLIADLMKEKKSVNEMEIFSELKYGRAEMRNACKKLIKDEKPEDRLWIDFDAEAGVYTLVGTGAKPPAGWSGYMPLDSSDIQLEEQEIV